MQKQRESGFEFIRAVCTIGIVLFHFSYIFIEYHIGGSPLQFQKYRNGDWGGLFVAMFFMLSGAVLMLNYGEKLSLGKFYFKRWLSLFPMFYVAWLVMYLINSRTYGTYFWGGPKWKFLYTLLGVDGYFWSMENTNYYCLGEWFLGAIILLYVLYPLMRFLFLKWRWITTVIITTAYVCNLYLDWFQISDGKNLLTCILDFWIGMLLVTYRDKLKNKYVAAIAFVCSGFFMFAPIPIKEVMCSTIVGTGWFIVLLFCAGFVMKYRVLSKPVNVISKYSYGVFLVHHVILYSFMKRYQYGAMNFQRSVILFILMFLLILVVGGVLSEVMGFVTGKLRKWRSL